MRTLALMWALLLPAMGLANHSPGNDTISVKLKSCLLQGDVACVAAKYKLLHGLEETPKWLNAFQNAFSLGNRRAGPCVEVARSIHLGLQRLGQRPQFLKVTVQGEPKVLGFDEVVNGAFSRNYQVAETGFHVAVKSGDKVIDAYTGLAGLPLQEYVNRITTHPTSRAVFTIIAELPESP